MTTITKSTIRSKEQKLTEQTQSEAKMNSLQNIQMWEMVSARQAEILKEAEREQLARLAMQSQPKTNWLSQLLRRPAHSPTIASAINANVTPELN